MNETKIEENVKIKMQRAKQLNDIESHVYGKAGTNTRIKEMSMRTHIALAHISMCVHFFVLAGRVCESQA